ncbi:MAG: hypothetical protein A6D92_04605 [Symbiobacterium thermophilum]|uniref:Uncharacterized protein n=1 Tax=Symbiobacterium thermophilum TaxID=2734 RepID=A0A1Y2T5F3_SYMTR|nr:MAG: hypothetical protein A6D92_04605 [Symbiobacterium thermophilum]
MNFTHSRFSLRFMIPMVPRVRSTRPYRARVMASRMVDLPAPVGPKMPKRPAPISSRKSISWGSR